MTKYLFFTLWGGTAFKDFYFIKLDTIERDYMYMQYEQHTDCIY